MHFDLTNPVKCKRGRAVLRMTGLQVKKLKKKKKNTMLKQGPESGKKKAAPSEDLFHFTPKNTIISQETCFAFYGPADSLGFS